MVFVAAACSTTGLTVDDVRGQFFDNNEKLAAWLECDGQLTSLSDPVLGPPGVDWNPDEVVDTTNDLMGPGEPTAATAIRAGNVWVLIDEGGRPFGGFEPGQDVLWCSNVSNN